jgi:hypothetical protein
MQPWLALHPQSGLKMPWPAQPAECGSHSAPRAPHQLRRRMELFQGRHRRRAGPAVHRRKLDSGDLPHDWSISRPFSERSRAAARAPTCPPASAGIARASSFRARRCGTPHPAAIRRRVPVQRCVDQRPAPGFAALWLHHVLLRTHSASPLWQRAEPRRRARGQLAPAESALVLRLRHQSPHLAHQHRTCLHRAVGHRRHHSADHCSRLPPSKSPRACAIQLTRPAPCKLRTAVLDQSGSCCAVDGNRGGDSRRWRPSLRAAHRRAPAQTLVAHYAIPLLRSPGAAATTAQRPTLQALPSASAPSSSMRTRDFC